jgi:hypothetical protein
MSLNHRGAAFLTAAALAAFFCAPPAFAQSQFEEDFDDAGKTWQEIAVQLPAAPGAENLIPFYVSPTATQNFSIDGKSLSIGKDGVIRYTMVATSPAGAKNISYEGIRCETFEKKSYAFARADGTWARSRKDQWEPIVRNAANRQHGVLALDYFCESKAISGNRETILQRLRGNQPINTRSDR